MESFYYSGKDGGISGWSTLKSLRVLASIAKAKRVQLSGLLEQIHPDVAIVDSNTRSSHCGGAHSDSGDKHIRDGGFGISESALRPPAHQKHFWLVEFADYLFHKHFCDLVSALSRFARGRGRVSFVESG